ncbi:MAG: PRC-barrel domain-containing protein [Patescibacteria group bacterium]
MNINLHKLTNLPVHTESGQKLGKVYDLEIDIDTHNVQRYLVRNNILSAKFFLIQNSQIKSISDEKIVVYDAALLNLAKADIAPEE